METENKEIHEQGKEKLEKRPRLRNKSEPKSLLKIELHEPLRSWICDAVTTLSERGLSISHESFFQEYMTRVTQADLEKWVESQTPLEWRVGQVLSDPEKARIIKKLFYLDSQSESSKILALESVLDGDSQKVRVPRKKKGSGNPGEEGPNSSLESVETVSLQ